MTPHSIAVELTDRRIKSPGGKDKWNPATVRRMLSNEKYKGDALLQKEFTVDYLEKKTKKNEGEVPQYYVEGNHEAIIDPSVFDLVQAELAKRSKKSETRYSGVSIFSNKIKCAECGGWYGAKVWHSNDKYRRVIYRCNHKFDGDKKCETPHVTEEEVIAAFIKAMNMVITERDEIIGNIKLIRQTVCNTTGLTEEQDKLRSEMEIVVELIQNCVAENARTAQNQEDYQKRYDGLVERYEKVKSRYDAIAEAIEEKQAHYEKLGIFIQIIEEHGEPITEFDAGMWGSMVEFITVDKNKNMTVTFKDGSEIAV